MENFIFLRSDIAVSWYILHKTAGRCDPYFLESNILTKKRYANFFL